MDASYGFHSLNMIVSGTDLSRTLTSSSTEPGPFPRNCEEKHSGPRNPLNVRSRELVQVLTRVETIRVQDSSPK